MTQTIPPHQEDLSFYDLLKNIYAARKAMISATLITLIIAAIILITASPLYKASITVSPANSMNGSQLSSLLSDDKLFAIRHMLSGNNNSTADYDSFEQILQGQDLARTILQAPLLVKGIIQDQQSTLSAKIFGIKSLTPATLSDYLTKKIKIQPVNGTSFRRISYTHPDPIFASQFLKSLHDIADTKLRTKTNENAAQRIAYLKDAITKTMNPEHRRALTTLLMEQERLKMISSINNQAYAAQIIEPAATQAKPAWPRPSLILTIALFIGALSGIILHNLRQSIYYNQNQELRPATKASYKEWMKQERSNTNTTSPPYSNKDAAE